MPPPETSSTAVPPPRPVRDRARPARLALFLAALLWYVCACAVAASAANGLTLRFQLGDGRQLLEALLQLFLVAIGVSALRTIERPSGPLRESLGLPVRPTSGEEWAMGAAIGWGMAVVSVLPMALLRALNMQMWNAPHAYYLLVLSVLALAAFTLSSTVLIFGYAFPRLVEATGPARATLILVAAVAVHAAMVPVAYDTPQGWRLSVEMLATVLLCLCWLRTHAVWLAWGVHFAWAASTAALFGLPLGRDNSFASIVDARAVGPAWLTGGSYGPAAAACSVCVLIAAIFVVVRVTGDYAWDYTHPPIVAGGYDVTVAPPAEHAAMEQSQEAAARVTLVQIEPLAPTATQPSSHGPH